MSQILNQELNFFEEMFGQATERVRDEYMHLRIAGSVSPQYRERVYCYELYHQLRVCYGVASDYLIGGEVDKMGHSYINGPNLNNVKPDLLVHFPGDMSRNLVAIEVKPIHCDIRGVDKDLKTLTALRKLESGYQKSVCLIYGDDEKRFASIKCRAKKLSENRENAVDLDVVDLYWHQWAGSPAQKMTWD